MRQAHGRVGGVDALAARSAGTVHVNAHVVHIEVDLDIVGEHGKHLDGGEGGVTALLDVGGADAHQAVHAVLAAQHAVGQTTFDLQGGLVQADGLRTGDQVEDLDLPAFESA